MNRLAPLIDRRPRAIALPAAPGFERVEFRPFGDPPPSPGEWRLFLTSFLSGLVFFGTFLA
jgi:hypothetical protein